MVALKVTQRNVAKCNGCQILTRDWRRVVLSADGEVVVDVSLCRKCETATLDAVRLVMQAVTR